MKTSLGQHGQEIKSDMNAIVAYHLTDVGPEKKTMTVIIDMANDYGDKPCMVMLKEGLESLSDHQK